jgi:cytochrome b subunit of formate dehydrogenase
MLAHLPARLLWSAALLGVLLTVSLPATAKTPNPSDDPKWCRVCHQDAVFAPAEVSATAHADVSCRECHKGFHFNPHEKVISPEGEPAQALKDRGLRVPDAWTACGDCHEVGENPGHLPHGKDKDGAKAGLPYCKDCHGSPHTIRLAKELEPNARRAEMNEKCITCHGDPKHMKPFKIPTDVVEGYEHTMHARHLHLGSKESPGCADCHGGHTPIDRNAVTAQPCIKCHANATPAFRKNATHAAMTADRRPISFWTVKFFAWLTFLTIFGLCLHVLLDLAATFRAARKGGGHGHVDHGANLLAKAGLVDKDRRVVRFDVHQRIMHGIMAFSFTTLVLTGWPLSAHGFGASRFLVDLFGGLQTAGLWHRIAAIGLVITSVYHVTYLVVLAFSRKLPLSMVPMPRDLFDAIGNIMYFLGLRKERPKFARFSYFEKFDYWAVFWGVVIMVGSGTIRWFPAEFAKIAPNWLYEVAFLAHADEALLAAMAIFVWHFYNVHLRPAVFPMSWVFLHGRLTVEELAEEHGAEYDALVEKAKAKVAKADDGKEGA